MCQTPTGEVDLGAQRRTDNGRSSVCCPLSVHRVEAQGIEPWSEIASNAASTCVDRSSCRHPGAADRPTFPRTILLSLVPASEAP